MKTHSRTCLCPACTGRRSVIFVVILAAALVCALCFSGCTGTVTPQAVRAQSASYDEGEATSGLIALVPGGAIITEHARTRYNALIGVYGGEFLPALVPDRGVMPANAEQLAGHTPGGEHAATVHGGKSAPRQTYFITNEALEKFRLMNLWRRMGRAPSAKK